MAKRKGDLEDFELPVWQNLGARWYTKVNSLARKYGMTRAALLEEAVTLYEKAHTQQKFATAKGGKVSEEDLRKVFGGFAKSWWDSLTPEQRAVEAKKRSAAAKVRWSGVKKPKG